ncbi:MAG: YlxR family protein [bacterium]
MDNKQILTKHIPVRTCIATGNKFPKKELLRVVSKDDSPIEYDPTGKKQGRGANISMTKQALELAIKKRSFERSFKRKITNEEIQYLRDNFDEAVEEKLFRGSPNKKVVVRIKKEDLQS